MRRARVVLGQSLRWSVLVVIGATGLAGLATAVDGGGGLAPLAALWLGVLRAPGLLLPLLPVLCGLAAGLAAARQAARGERRALELSGHAPAATAALGLCVALALGGLGWLAHDRVVPGVEARADALGGQAEAPWVFVQGQAVRMRDGVVVTVVDDAIADVGTLPATGLAGPALRQAAAAQRPARSPVSALQATADRPARTELAARRARIVAAGLLAFLGWLPLARLPATQAGVALGAGLCWAAADVALRAAAGQGRVGPLVGGWGAVVLVVGLVVAATLWTGRTRRPLVPTGP